MSEYGLAKIVDQWSAVLTQELSASGTIAYVDPVLAQLLPGANGDRGYTLTLDDGAGTFEVVQVSNANGTTGALSLARNIWGTTSQIWPIGTKIELRLPAGLINAHMQRLPVAVHVENATTFHTLQWKEWTATYLTLTQDITNLDMQSLIGFTTDLQGMIFHDVLIQQDAVGGRTVNWDSTLIHWPGGGLGPTISPAANALDIFRIFRVSPGQLYYAGIILGQNIPM